MGESEREDFIDSNIDEYVRKFGSSSLFIKKIINSLNFPFSIINRNLEIEVSNIKGLSPGAKCYKVYHNRDSPCSDYGEPCPVKKAFMVGKSNSMIMEGDKKIHNKHHEVHAHPIFDGRGEVASVIKYDFDKDEIVNTEKKLDNVNSIIEKLERNYGRLYNNLNDAFSLNEMVYDEEGKAIDWIVLKVNGRFCDLFEIKKNVIEGKLFSDIDAKMVSENIEYFDKILKDGKAQKKETILSPNERKIKISTFKSEGNQFVSIIKESSGGGGKLEKQFNDILQNSQDLVYRYNFKEDKFDYVSESVFTILGYPLGEFMEMGMSGFKKKIHLDDVGKMEEAGDESEREVSSTIEARIKKKNGKYVWLRIRRAIFRDENGKLTSCIGGMIDISAEKLAEEERKKLKERIILMRGKESATKERVSLTDREKIVLWGLCRYPLLNDEELAKKINLKRSTLTAIRNRLKQKKWFSLNYIPNFHKLGCQFSSIFDTSLAMSKTIRDLDLSSTKKYPEVILSNYQDDKFFGIFVSDKYVNFKKFLDEFTKDNEKILKFGLNENSFFYSLDNIEIRDSSGIINSLFNLKRKEKVTSHKFTNGGEKLNTNEKRVLHAIVENPDMSSSEIAKKIWASKPTVIKIRKKLLDENFIYPIVIPDFKKLGFPYVAKLSFDFDSEIPAEIKNGRDDPRVLLGIIGGKSITKIMLFASEEEYMEEIELVRDAYRKSGIYFRLDSEIFPIQKRRSNNFGIEPFLNELLFGDEI